MVFGYFQSLISGILMMTPDLPGAFSLGLGERRVPVVHFLGGCGVFRCGSWVVDNWMVGGTYFGRG